MMFKDKYINKFYAFALAAVFAIALAGCGGGGGTTATPDPEPPPMPTPYEQAVAAIAAAETEEAAQAAYDAVKEDVTAAQGEKLQEAVDARIMAIQTAARVADQKEALSMAAGNIDTSDLSTQEAVDAANEAIRAFRQALEDAEDVSDEDKEMYQTQLDDAVTAVDGAQDGINTATRRTNQTAALTSASETLQAALAALAGSTPTQAQLDAANAAVTALNEAIAAGADLTEAEKATYVREAANAAAPINTAQMAFNADEDEDQKAADAAMAKLGKNLLASLTGTDTTPDTGVRQNGLFALSADGKLTINSPSSGGPGRFEGDAYPDNPPANWEASDSVESLGGWAGASYAHTHATTKVVNEARVYNNQGAPKRVAFAKALPTGVTIATATDNAASALKGYLLVAIAGAVETALDIGKVTGATFTHSGIQTHTYAPDSEVGFMTRGYYDGAPGMYRCVSTDASACSSTNDGKGAPSALGGTWHFKPDAGAMVSQPDADFLYYGWWVNKNEDGEPMLATAFAGVVGTPANGGDLTAITGSATYAGNAAGKFAMSNPLDGTGSGGHFTADAELKATFSGTTTGVTGTIDNFRLNDGTEDPGWSVALNRGALGSSGGTISAANTVWSINGNKAPASGSWSGTMYDEMPGDPPNGDGSNIPTTVTGTFYSKFSNIGRMVGGFGATKQ